MRSARTWALAAGLASAVTFALLLIIGPHGPASCPLGVAILCVQLPAPGERWSAALAAPGLTAALWLDFVFLVAWSVFYAALGRHRGGALAVAIPVAAALAGTLDGAENAAVLVALGAPDRAAPGLVGLLAGTKLAMVGGLVIALAVAARGPWRWVERAGALAGAALLAVPFTRDAALVGLPGVFLAFLAALAGLWSERRNARPAEGS